MVLLKHSEEVAHSEVTEIPWWNVAQVHTYILGIEKKQLGLPVTTTTSPYGKPSESMLMLLFCIISVSRLLSLASRAFHISADRAAQGWMAGLALPCSHLTQELVLTHHHLFAEAVAWHTLWCCGGVVLDCGLCFYTWEISCHDSRSCCGGAWRGHPPWVPATATVTCWCCQSRTQKPTKNAYGKMLQGASNSALPSGHYHFYLPFPRDVFLTL